MYNKLIPISALLYFKFISNSFYFKDNFFMFVVFNVILPNKFLNFGINEVLLILSYTSSVGVMQ